MNTPHPLAGRKQSPEHIAKRAAAMTRHGAERNGLRWREYHVWDSMIQRCTNPNADAFRHYGARGIKVCERWRKFENFLADMGRRPAPGLSLDRYPNADGNYEPGNVRWATAKQQAMTNRGCFKKGYKMSPEAIAKRTASFFANRKMQCPESR